MTAIEPQQDGTNPRKKLYSALVGNSNPEAKSHFKKFSFEQFNKRLDDEKFVEDLYQSLRDNDVVLDPKNRQPEQNYYDFIDAYVKVPTAKPAAPVAKPAAAPVAAPVAAAPIEQAAPIPSVEPMEEEEIPEVEYEGQMLPEVTATPAPYQFPEPGTLAYEKISRSNPPIGSPEYDFKIAMLNQPPKLALGPGGYTQDMAASLPETMEKAKQSSLSPVFKDYEVAQKMMKGEVPLVTQKDVREAKEGFGRATKEQQQAAIMGGPGYEYEQEKRAKERGKGEATSDLAKSLGALAESIGENIFNATKQVALGFSNIGVTPMGEDEPEAFYYKRERARRNEDMYRDAKATQDEFQKELAKLNIQTSVYDAIQKGQWNRVPEATAYTIGEAALQMGAFFLTRGGSAYLQTLPQEYQRGVEAIAKETNRTPEQVIADGDDAELTAMLSSGIQYGFEKFGMDQMSKGMRSKGGYKAVRDWLLKNTGNKNLARAGGLGAVAGIESLTESSQAGVSQAAELSTSQKPFMAKVDKFLTDPNFIKERKQAATAGAIGGLALGAGGRAVTKAFEKGPDITQFSPEVQGNEIIQEATRGYQDNIAKAEEQGRKPDAYNKRELNKLATDPEAWVKGEIKYLTQTIQDNKKNNIDSKVEETKLSRANALLAQIKAEKKGMEQAALAPAQEAAPVAPVAPAETVTAPEAVAPETPVTETAPVTEEAPVAEEAIPVAPETEEDYSFLEETELTPEEEAALLAQEEAAPVAPVEEEVVAEEVPAEEVAVEEAAPEAPAAPAKEVGVGGIIYGHEDIVGNKGLGDVRSQLPEENSGVIIANGKDGNQYAVAFSRKGGDRQNIFEQTPAARPGHIYTSVKIDDPSNAQEVEQAKKQAEAALAEILPTVKGGNIRASAVQQAITDFQTKKPAEPAPAPKAKKAPAPKAETKQEAPKPEPKKEEKGKVATRVEEYEGVFNPNKTGVSGIDELLKDDGYQFFYKGKKVERVLMSPDEYLERVRRGLKTKTDANILAEKTDAIKKAIESGAKINAPFISTIGGKFAQEGRNRAVVARELGEQKIPVFIESDVTLNDKINRGAELVKQSQEKGNKTKDEVLEDVKKSGLHRDGVRFIEENYDEIQKSLGVKTTEAKPVSTTPQEGATVEIPAQRAEFGTRKMVFKDGEWKQNVGGDILKVGPAVQQQAQEAFAGKEETKPAETKTEVAPKEEGKKPAPKEEKGKPIKSNWNYEGEGDFLTGTKELREGKSAYVIKQLNKYGKGYYRAKQRGELDLESPIKYEQVDDSRIIAIDGNGNTIGFLGLQSDGGVDHIVVAPEFERKGIATELVNRIKEFGRKVDFEKSKLISPDAAKFFNKYNELSTKSKSETASTTSLASQVEDMRSLPPAKRKAAQQALEERYGKEDVEKMIEITANFTKIIDDLEQRGVVKIDCP